MQPGQKVQVMISGQTYDATISAVSISTDPIEITNDGTLDTRPDPFRQWVPGVTTYTLEIQLSHKTGQTGGR
jgi:hypothetical protein